MAGARPKLYGAPWRPHCRRSKQFLGEHRIPFEWIDITDDEKAIELAERINDGSTLCGEFSSRLPPEKMI